MQEASIQKVKKLNENSINKFKQNKVEEAIKIGLEALGILLKNHVNTDYIAICYYNLGSFYLQLFENKKKNSYYFSAAKTETLEHALDYLKKALNTYQTLNNTAGIKKAETKLDSCLKHKLWNKLTSLQEKVFEDRHLKPIHIAVILNDFSIIKELYARNNKCLEEHDGDGWSTLTYALFFKASSEIIDFLIEHLIHVNPQYLSNTYEPLPFTSAHNYYAEINARKNPFAENADDMASLEKLNVDSDSGNALDDNTHYPPVYYALVRSKIISNLIGTWSTAELTSIIQLLIAAAPTQLVQLKKAQNDEDNCALTKALACKMPKEIIELLIEHTPPETLDYVLKEQSILVKCLEQGYPRSIIEFFIKKNPESIKQTDLGIPPLFAAIYSKASIDVLELIYEQDTKAAKVLTGAAMLGYWDDDEWIPGYNVTSLIMALLYSNFAAADFLIQKEPSLIAMKDEQGDLPITSINWEKAPHDFAKKLISLSISGLYKEADCQNKIRGLLTHKTKAVAQLAFRLGLATNIDFSESITGIDTTNCIVIGMSINGITVTRQTPGFSQSITNLDELVEKYKQGSILITNQEFEHYIKLTQLILLSIEQSLQRENRKYPAIDNRYALNGLEKWLILNKPAGSLTHLCLRFMRNNYTAAKINEIQGKLPDGLSHQLKL